MRGGHVNLGARWFLEGWLLVEDVAVFQVVTEWF